MRLNATTTPINPDPSHATSHEMEWHKKTKLAKRLAEEIICRVMLNLKARGGGGDSNSCENLRSAAPRLVMSARWGGFLQTGRRHQEWEIA